tara:strand:+ start:231 stop:2237 length:2007 start_codon:yes stop_codon:yes gene_type:complete
MPRTTLALTSFVSGELGAKLDGRTDFAKYSTGAKTLENFLIHPQGSATRRVGTQFIAEVKDSTKKTRLIPFEFSTVQTYVLEFGNQYMRVYKDKGQVQSGGSAFELATPYLEAELFEIKFAQSADVLFICHPNHAARKLARTGHTSWTLTEIDFTDGPYLSPNATSTTLTPSGTTGSVNITASASTFAATDVGRLVSFSSGRAKITGFTSATVVAATTQVDFANTNAVTDWKLGAFSGTTGHPSCVSFFEQRLVFAGTLSEPQTLYFSKSGDYENMTTGTNADDAMVYTIASNQVNRIRYLKSVRTLLVGTSGGEFTVSADGTDAAITPTNIVIKKQSSYGTANVDAQPAGNSILFLQKAKRKIRELSYNFDTDGYVAPDLTILNDIVTKSGINEMAYQQEPDSILWCVRDDGILAGLTYQRSEAVIAWHRHKLGGTFGTGSTATGYGVVESVASISGQLTEDDFYVIVKRTINGATKRYVEAFAPFDFDETDATDFRFADSHLTYSGSATTTLSGLAHLEGQTVSVLADGATHADKVVSSGQISLDRSATKAVVGLAYDSVLQTMRVEGGAAEGTSQGKTKRISKVVLRLFETVGVKVGPSLSNLETIPFRTTSSQMNNPVDTLLAGDKEIEFRDDYNTDGFIFVKQDQPLPLSVLAIYPTVVTSDG